MLKRYTYGFTLFAVSAVSLNRFQNTVTQNLDGERGVSYTDAREKKVQERRCGYVHMRKKFGNGIPTKNTSACSVLLHLCARE
jgi:hypothetical protein